MIKKKINFIVDVETVGMKERKIINLGLVVGDNKGNVLETHEWNIQNNIIEGYQMPEAWQFYLARVHAVNDEVTRVNTFKDCFTDILEIMTRYRTDWDIEFWSYNASFDYGAFMDNLKYEGIHLTTKQTKWFNYRWFCIWNYSANVLMNRPSYRKFAKENNHYTEKGNMITNAEVCYRYISNDKYFIEEHTGLADAQIEYKILMYCKRQGKKAIKHRAGGVWQIPQKKRNEFKKDGWL